MAAKKHKKGKKRYKTFYRNFKGCEKNLFVYFAPFCG